MRSSNIYDVFLKSCRNGTKIELVRDCQKQALLRSAVMPDSIRHPQLLDSRFHGNDRLNHGLNPSLLSQRAIAPPKSAKKVKHT